jgi:hypothetical protein
VPAGRAAFVDGIAHLGRLKRLSLRCSTGARELEALGALTSLEELDLGGCAARHRAGSLLAAASFPSLRRLSIAEGRIGTNGAKALAKAPWLKRLRALDVSGNVVGADGLKSILESSSLVELDAERDSLDGKLAPLVAGCGSLGALAWLSLRGNGIDDAGVKLLAASRGLRSLAWIDLSHNVFGEAGVRALLDTKLPRLAGVRLGKVPRSLLTPLRARFPLVETDILAA